jgi:Tfp pilus assembly protein PilO
MIKRFLTKREKIIFYLTIAIVTFSVVFNFFLAPLLSKISTLNREIRTTRAKFRKYSWLLAQKDQLHDKYNQLALQFRLPQVGSDALVGVLSELENLARDANIRLVDIRPQGEGKRDLSKGILVDLRTEGTMEGYLKFIYGIENSLLLLQIKKVQLSAKVNSPTLEGSFSISQLSLKE